MREAEALAQARHRARVHLDGVAAAELAHGSRIGKSLAEHPLPDPAPWAGIQDPAERLRVALSELYAYFAATEAMTARILRDLPELPVMQEVAAPLEQYWESVRGILARGWDAPGASGGRLRAVIGHALAFDTWRSLVRSEDLAESDAVELMVRLARAV